MANQKPRSPGTFARPRRNTFVPADSRAKVVRRPSAPRAANDNTNPRGSSFGRASIGALLVAAGAILAVFLLAG